MEFALLVTITGMVVVFAALIFLTLCIWLLGKIVGGIGGGSKKDAAPAPQNGARPAKTGCPRRQTCRPGTAGGRKRRRSRRGRRRHFRRRGHDDGRQALQGQEHPPPEIRPPPGLEHCRHHREHPPLLKSI